MKFRAQKTGQCAVADGTHVVNFVKDTEYDFDDEHIGTLQEHGFAPTDKPKAAHRATENKMAHPVTDNKLKLKPKP